MARLRCLVTSGLFVALVTAGCRLGPVTPTVVDSWKVNPSNIDAFVDNRNSRNQILVTRDSIYVAFSGVISGQRTTDVFLRRLDRNSGEWDPTRRISSSDGLSRAPAVVVDGDTVHYAWMSDRSEQGGDVSIAYRQSLDRGATWSEPERLEIGNIRTRHPKLVRAGETLYLYLSNSSGGQPEEIILYVSRDRGGSWREQRFGSPAEGRMATRPQLVLADAGTAYLAWVDHDGRGRSLVVVSTRDFGRTWSTPAAINDSTRPAPQDYAVCRGRDNQLIALWWLRVGTASRVVVDRSADGGRSWGADRVIYDRHVRIITLICEAFRDNKILIAWAAGSSLPGEVGMQILYDVVDAAEKAGGSGVTEQQSLVGPPEVGRIYHSFDVVRVGSNFASVYATGGSQPMGVFLSASSDLALGFSAGVQVSKELPHIDSLAPTLARLDNRGLAVLYNSRKTSSNPTERATMLGDLFLATLELR